jgi:hypothetical protein
MEAIQTVDLNFTNGGGGHSATLGTFLNAKSVQTGGDMGVVIGDMGDFNAFSNDSLNDLMSNFVCTEISTAAQPNYTSRTRKYVDKTSLLLKSHMVLVRGRDCGPRGTLDFGVVDPSDPSRVYGGEVPFFSEVINSPNIKDSLGREFPFPSLPPMKHGSIIAAGRIYNFESAAEYDGIKINLVYNNRELQENLSLNDEAVSAMYKGFRNENNVFFGGPDLQQYDLKLGYTLTDFFSMLSLANVQMDPENNLSNAEGADDVLFEASGTLESVVGTVASYFGYFWFVNPFNGYLSFINTQEASQLEITDYTKSENQDENMVNASFTESLKSPKIVNVFSGTGEKKEDKEPKDEDRPKRVFFKRYDILADVDYPDFGRRDTITGKWYFEEEIGALFALFNQGSDDPETFDKFMFRLLHDNYDPKWRKPHAAKDDNCNRWGMALDNPDAFNANMDSSTLQYGGLYWGQARNYQTWDWGPKPKNHNAEKKGAMAYIWDLRTDAKSQKRRRSALKFGPAKDDVYDRFDNQFQYISCNSDLGDHNVKMTRPSQSDLYTFMKAFYAIAGGIYVSNPYGRYRVERMQFQNTNNLTIVGPVDGNTLIKDIDDLSQLWDVLSILKVKSRLKVRDLWLATKAVQDGFMKTEAVHDFHFIAIRNLPKLERKNGQENDMMVDFRGLKMLEFLEGENAGIADHLFLGGPTVGLREGHHNFFINDAVSLSWSNYKKAKLLLSKSLPMEYKRTKTRVNKIIDDPFEEEKEDNDMSESSSGANKMAELFDRFDLKYFRVSGPEYNMLNDLSLSSHSGGVTEMIALEKIKGEYEEEPSSTKTSVKTMYGLHIPEYTPTITSLSIRVAGDGITTTINESTIKLLPPSQSFLLNKANEAVVTSKGVASWLSAGQKNRLGL